MGVCVCDVVWFIGKESAPIYLAQCRFTELAVSNVKTSVHFSSKLYGSNIVKQHSEIVMVWNYQNADCSYKKYCHLLLFSTHFCSLCHTYSRSLNTEVWKWTLSYCLMLGTLYLYICDCWWQLALSDCLLLCDLSVYIHIQLHCCNCFIILHV